MTLTPQQINAAIAQACGWKRTVEPDEEENPMGFWVHPDKSGLWIDLPDFHGSLDAMAQAEESLRNNQFHFVDYPRQLFKVVSGREWDGDMGYFFFNLINASAAQRAEAFVIALNLTTP